MRLVVRLLFYRCFPILYSIFQIIEAVFVSDGPQARHPRLVAGMPVGMFDWRRGLSPVTLPYAFGFRSERTLEVHHRGQALGWIELLTHGVPRRLSHQHDKLCRYILDYFKLCDHFRDTRYISVFLY